MSEPDFITRLRAWSEGTASVELPITYSAGSRLFAMDVQALLEERDEWQRLVILTGEEIDHIKVAEAERDAAWAEVAQLRNLLVAANDVIDWTGRDLLTGPGRSFPDVMRRYQDMRTRAMIAASPVEARNE